MWCALLKTTKITIDTCRRDERVVEHLSSHACNVLETMLQAKTKEQRNYIELLAKKESCDGVVSVYEDEISYKVDAWFDVDISFDTMAKIVDYLREQNKEVK